MKHRAKILFDKKSATLILRAFGVEIDEDGFLKHSNTGEIVCDPEGGRLTQKTFGGILKGKNGETLFVRKDLLTSIKIADKEY